MIFSIRNLGFELGSLLLEGWAAFAARVVCAALLLVLGGLAKRLLSRRVFPALLRRSWRLAGTPILLTRHLIEMVQDAAINTNHAQLIFTTHDTGLLDLTLLRRDQIWFAEKDEKTMQTDIYALTEFSPRKGENISKGYLQGRYGAIPFIGGDAAWAE